MNHGSRLQIVSRKVLGARLLVEQAGIDANGCTAPVLQHHRASAHLGTLAHVDVAQNFGAGTDQHTVCYFRMAIAFLFARAA